MCDVWPGVQPDWSLNNYEELMKIIVKVPPKVTLSQIIDNSNTFPVEFPVDTVRCKNLTGKTTHGILEKNINSVYPIIHECVLILYVIFLQHKRKFGSEIERELYKDIDLEMLVDRLLTKRAVAFVGCHDRYMLLDGFARSGHWESIGTNEEEEPITLKNCLSYDEIKLSALLSVSSYTQFINVGDRNNCGRLEQNKNRFEENGIIIGLIGARFEKRGVMEYQEIVVTKEQNIPEHGYGNTYVPTARSMFFNFYGGVSLTYDQFKNQFNDKGKFTEVRKETFFNNIIYERRLTLSMDTLLIEANHRARSEGKLAYVHVVGFGLGVWRVSQHQNKLFMDTFAKRIEVLSINLNHIGVICFSYIGQQCCGKFEHGDIMPIENHENKGITIHITNREPHDKLKKPYEGYLLVVSYAWDGNALPGNEFWWGQLAASGDPAAACSSQIAELHNPHINPAVCGANLRVATPTGLLTLEEYQQKAKCHYGK